MTKNEFVDQVADRAGLSKKDAAAAVDAFLETIEGALTRGGEVSFSGFGKFSVSHRSAREGRPDGKCDRGQTQKEDEDFPEAHFRRVAPRWQGRKKLESAAATGTR